MVELNPFKFRVPVIGEEFTGRKRELLRIFASVNNGESVSIFGPRRVGRTSLLHHILSPHTFKGFKCDRDEYILILIDLREMKADWNEEDLLRKMTSSLIEEAKLEERYFSAKDEEPIR